MNLKKVISNKYSNWEVTSNEREIDKQVLNSAQKTPITFSEVKRKYAIAESDMIPEEPKVGIDKKWVPAFISPKNKSSDTPVDKKVRFFNENGEEMASQG